MEMKFEDRSFWQSLLWSKLHKGKFNFIECTDSEIVKTTHHVLGKKVRTSAISISDIVFFDRRYGIFKEKIYTGSGDNISFKGLKKGSGKQIFKYLCENGCRLEGGSDSKKHYTKNFLFFRTSEYVQCTKDGLIDRIETRRFARNSFVPYDKIDYVLMQPQGFMTKSLICIGALSFSTRRPFGIVSANSLMKELKQYITISDGKVYHPCIFSGIKKRKSLSLIFTDDCVIYSDARSTLKQKVMGKNTEEVLVFRSISKRKCKPFFSLFKRVAYIEGQGSVDLRTNTAQTYEIEFPGIFFFTWYGIKKRLKKFR